MLQPCLQICAYCDKHLNESGKDAFVVPLLEQFFDDVRIEVDMETA